MTNLELIYMLTKHQITYKAAKHSKEAEHAAAKVMELMSDIIDALEGN